MKTPVRLLLLLVLAGPASAAGRFDPSARVWAIPRDLPPSHSVASGAAGSRDIAQPAGGSDWSFSPNVRAHPAQSGQHLWPDIAAGPGGVIGVAWMDDHAPGGYHVFYCQSLDGGATWSAPEQVDTRVTGAYSKFVDLDFTPSGIAVAVWEDDRGGVYNAYLSRRDPAAGGTPWTTNVKVNTAGSPPSGSDFMNPSLGVLDNDRWFIAWTDWREGVYHQVYARATRDRGATFTVERRVSDALGLDPVAGDPCLVADRVAPGPSGAETLYCVTNDWRGFAPGGRYPNVFFYRSTNGGLTWTTGVQVNDVAPYFQQTSSHALAQLDDGALVAGWLNGDFVSSHFHVNVSEDEGATWETSAQVDEASPGGAGVYSSVVTLGGRAFAAFDIYEGNWNVYFRASADGGRTWTEPMARMDDDASGGPAGNAVLAPRTPGDVAAAWQDGRGSAWQIFASRGTRAGTGVAGAPAAGTRPALVAYPNPSRVGDEVRLAPAPGAPRAGSGIVVCYPTGRRLRTLDTPGDGARWDGRDAAGRESPPGVYWVRPLEGGASTAIVRLPR